MPDIRFPAVGDENTDITFEPLQKATMTGQKYYVATSLLLASACCQAASTAALTVTGKVEPSSCSLTLTGGGSVDFLTMNMVTLHGYEKRNAVAFVVPSKTVPLVVTCLTATAVALNLVDNAAASKPAIDTNDAYYYGLGLNGTKQIGAYSVNFSNLRVGSGGIAGSPLGYLTRPVTDTTGSWTVTSTAAASTMFSTDTSVGFRLGGAETSPAALTAISGTLQITPLILITTAEAALAAYNLAGSATLSLLYI